MNLDLLVELVVSGSVAGAKVGIAAIGFAIIFYTTREMHFAFGAVSVGAAYVCYWVLRGAGGGSLGVVLGMAASFAVTMLFSVFLHKAIYLRLKSVMPVVMASLGLSLIVENVIQIVGTADTQILVYPNLIQIVQIDFLRVRVLEIAVFVLFIVIAIGVDLFLNHTRLGHGLAATMEDPEMAELVGVRTAYMRIGAYSAGAALGALSGMIMLVDTGVRPGNGFIFLLYALIITIMGRGNLRSVVIWSLLFGVLRSLWSWRFATDYQELVMFGLMVSYLMVRDAWDRYQRDRIRPVRAAAVRAHP